MKAAAGLEAVAERQELERRHRLEDVDLGDQHLEDREDALEGVERARAVVGAQQLLEIVELVQHLLEPQLVHLVHDDEQRFVVLGTGTLQRQQFVPGDRERNVLLTADYSQIELRILAHFTHEPVL